MPRWMFCTSDGLNSGGKDFFTSIYLLFLSDMMFSNGMNDQEPVIGGCGFDVSLD
jgi:hypothetical protein